MHLVAGRTLKNATTISFLSAFCIPLFCLPLWTIEIGNLTCDGIIYPHFFLRHSTFPLSATDYNNQKINMGGKHLSTFPPSTFYISALCSGMRELETSPATEAFIDISTFHILPFCLPLQNEGIQNFTCERRIYPYFHLLCSSFLPPTGECRNPKLKK